MTVPMQRRLAEILRENTDVPVISEDKARGTDSKRPFFVVSVQDEVTPFMHNRADVTAYISIDYYGESSLDRHQMVDTLNRIFALHFSVDRRFYLIKTKKSLFQDKNILLFNFSTDYQIAIDTDTSGLAVDPTQDPDWIGENDDLMKELHLKQGGI